mmetsp:Transcript_21786/g.67051  ORF Transcript_21786/g.67051 Transcript_21786/m.67051 type:complete len:131 (+) Transcript_21786:1892-2284(+)
MTTLVTHFSISDGAVVSFEHLTITTEQRTGGSAIVVAGGQVTLRSCKMCDSTVGISFQIGESLILESCIMSNNYEYAIETNNLEDDQRISCRDTDAGVSILTLPTLTWSLVANFGSWRTGGVACSETKQA